jgi:hypothetical protein
VYDILSGATSEPAGRLGAVSDPNQPDGTDVSGEAENLTDRVVVHSCYERCAEAFVDCGEKNEHCSKATVEDAVEVGAAFPISGRGSLRVGYTRDNDRSRRNEHLTQSGLAEIVLDLLVPHDDELLGLCMSRAGEPPSAVEDPIDLVVGNRTVFKPTTHAPPAYDISEFHGVRLSPSASGPWSTRQIPDKMLGS